MARGLDRRFRRFALLGVVLHTLFVAAAPFEHHDLICHLKTPQHCTACTSSPVGSSAAAQALRAEIDQLRNDFAARLAALETKLAAIAGETGRALPPAPAPPPTAAAQGPQPTVAVPAGAEGAGGPSGSLPVYGNASAA